jgi:Ca2+-binding RTX toxin-like protein
MPAISGSGTVEGTELDDTITSTNEPDGQGGYQFDIFSGNGGNDTIFGGPGYNTLYGGEGNDYLDNSQATLSAYFAGAGNWDSAGVLSGGGGDDTIIGSAYYDYIDGGYGNDVIDAGDGRDGYVVFGGADQVDMGAGDDWVVDRANDVLSVGEGFEGTVIDGGSGFDTYSLSSGVVLSLHARYNVDGSLTLWWNPDVEVGLTLYNFESILNPLIFANPLFDDSKNLVNFNALTTDQLFRIGESGSWGLYNGRYGDDVVTLPDGDRILLTQSVTWDNLRTFYAEGGDDTVTGGDLRDRIDGGTGNDYLAGNGGSDILNGGDGVDVLVASLNDGANDYDQLDGGAGRDTFYVNNADVVAQFETIDDAIFFSTPFSVERAAIIYDPVTNATEIRAYADDLSTYDSIEITNGIRSDMLTAQFYAGAYGNGMRIENIGLTQAIFGFAVDSAAVSGNVAPDFDQLVAQALGEQVKQSLVDLAIDDVGLGAVDDYIARKAALDTAEVASSFLAHLGTVVNIVEFVDAMVTIGKKYFAKTYENNTTEFIGDVGAALSDLLLPVAGGTIFKVGTAIATELVVKVIIEFGDSITASYLQLADARSATSTPGDDIVIIEKDGTSWHLDTGDDLAILDGSSQSSSMPGQRLAAQAAAPTPLTIDGGDGNDTLVFSGRNPLTIDLAAGTAEDLASAYSLVSIENVGGGAGDDSIVGNELGNSVSGEDGADAISGAGGNDTLSGGDGNDRLLGETGDDLIDGGGDNDMLDGGAGADQLYGGSGDDTFLVDQQADLVFENAGEGTDSVLASSSYYLYAEIENLTLAGAGDTFGVGNALANTITGNEGSNLLIAGLGNDTVHGGGGVDSLFGEDGADALYGDAGIDYLVGGVGNDTLDGGADADAVYGEAGDDTLTGGTGFVTDILVGGDGNDTLRADSGMNDYDLIDGGAGNDAYYVDTGDDLTFEGAGGGTDTVYADVAGANNGVYLYAEVENLVLLGTTAFGVGNELANTLTGSASGNWLLGGAGNDSLNGKAGGDVLFGEAGNDTFVFEHGTGGDVIGDFTHGADKMNLADFHFASFAALQAGFHQSGSDGAIDLGGGDFVVLLGVTMATLDAGDFVL